MNMTAQFVLDSLFPGWPYSIRIYTKFIRNPSAAVGCIATKQQSAFQAHWQSSSPKDGYAKPETMERPTSRTGNMISEAQWHHYASITCANIVTKRLLTEARSPRRRKVFSWSMHFRKLAFGQSKKYLYIHIRVELGLTKIFQVWKQEYMWNRLPCFLNGIIWMSYVTSCIIWP
jgi:hypothetical protein